MAQITNFLLFPFSRYEFYFCNLQFVSPEIHHTFKILILKCKESQTVKQVFNISNEQTLT